MYTIKAITYLPVDENHPEGTWEWSTHTLYNPLMAEQGCTLTEGTIELELGKAGSAELTIPITNPLYNKLGCLKSIIQIFDTKDINSTVPKEVFCGRILHSDKDFYGNLKLYLEGNLAYLIDKICPFPKQFDKNGQPLYPEIFNPATGINYIVADYKYAGPAHSYLGYCLNRYNEQTVGIDPHMMFQLSDALGNEYAYISSCYDTMQIEFEEHEYTTVQDSIYNKIVEPCGGYLRTRFIGYDPNGFPMHTIDYLAEDDIDQTATDERRFWVSPQSIKFGENLIDFTRSMTGEETFTVLIPLGKMIQEEVTYQELNPETQQMEEHKKTVDRQRYDITGVTRNPDIDPQDQGKEYVRDPFAQMIYGNVWKTVVWDDVEDPNVLYGNAHTYLGNYNHHTLSMSINAIDLGLLDVNVVKFRLGDYFNIISAPHHVNDYVQLKKMTINLLDPGQSEYTFETVQHTLSETTSSASSSVESVKTELGKSGGGSSASTDALEKRIYNLEQGSIILETEEHDVRDIWASVKDWRERTFYVRDSTDPWTNPETGVEYHVDDLPTHDNGVLEVKKLPNGFGYLTFHGDHGTVWHTVVFNGEIQTWKEFELT